MHAWIGSLPSHSYIIITDGSLLVFPFGWLSSYFTSPLSFRGSLRPGLPLWRMCVSRSVLLRLHDGD